MVEIFSLLMFLSPCQSSGGGFLELSVPAKLGNVASQGVREGGNYGEEENHMAIFRKKFDFQ